MKKHIITGLIIFLPLLLTIWVLYFLFEIISVPFAGISLKILSFFPRLSEMEGVVYILAKILAIITIFILAVILGILTQLVVFKSFFSSLDAIFLRIPVIRRIHKTTKQIASSFFAPQKEKVFEEAVLIHFPSKMSAAVGFVSGDAAEVCQKKKEERLLSIFVPGSPQPIAGYLLFASKNSLISSNLTVEEALQYTVSCGVLVPEKNERRFL